MHLTNMTTGQIHHYGNELGPVAQENGLQYRVSVQDVQKMMNLSLHEVVTVH